jgi:hypothetical protein
MTTTPQDIQWALDDLALIVNSNYDTARAGYLITHEKTLRHALQSAAPVQDAGGLDALKRECTEIALKAMKACPNYAGPIASDIVDHLAPMLRPVPPLCHAVDFGTYENAVQIITPQGNKATIDICMIPEIKWLWDQGVQTIECCCGHGKLPGYVAVTDDSRPIMDRLGYIPDQKAPHCYLTKIAAPQQPGERG